MNLCFWKKKIYINHKEREYNAPRWFIFGRSIDGTLVDIYDGDNDIATVKVEDAEKIITAHNKCIDWIENKLN